MLNHIVIMGRLVKDPELRATGSGTKVSSFRIACDRDYSANGEKQTDFIDCVAWRSTGEFVSRNFSKGMPITVSGRLQIRDYTTREGDKRRIAEINVSDAYFCGGERQAQKSSGLQEVEDDGKLPWDDDEDGELPL